MGLLDATMSTAAGIAVFAIVVAVVSTVLTGLLPMPVGIAVPVGVGFGMAALTGTYIGLAGKTSTVRYRVSFASGAFGVTFLGVFVVAFGVGDLAFALASATGAGVLAAVGAAVAMR